MNELNLNFLEIEGSTGSIVFFFFLYNIVNISCKVASRLFWIAGNAFHDAINICVYTAVDTECCISQSLKVL